jgi:hypothetical protein
LLAPTPPLIEGSLGSLQPIRLEVADSQRVRQQVRQWLRQFHYRGFQGPVGENVQYLAQDRQGRDLAVMVFGAAAWKVADRDHFIGWSVEQRTEQLSAIGFSPAGPGRPAFGQRLAQGLWPSGVVAGKLRRAGTF